MAAGASEATSAVQRIMHPVGPHVQPVPAELSGCGYRAAGWCMKWPPSMRDALIINGHHALTTGNTRLLGLQQVATYCWPRHSEALVRGTSMPTTHTACACTPYARAM